MNKLLADNGRAAGLSADQLQNARAAQAAYSHAVETFLSPAEKAQKLAALDAQIAAARTPTLKASLGTQREQIALAGQVVTAEDATAQARSKGAAALATASKAGENHAATLAKEVAAQEAQIANLYRLADAYGVSGAAALIAEARVKAQSQAIKQGADVEAAVDRQVQLSIAQRVSSADKSISRNARPSGGAGARQRASRRWPCSQRASGRTHPRPDGRPASTCRD